MTDQLISFKTAKLAKEKGCDEPCELRYDREEKIVPTKLGMHGYPNHYSESYATYTQSLLQKWLWETFDIFIEIQFSPIAKSFRAKVFYPIDEEKFQKISILSPKYQKNGGGYYWIYGRPDHQIPGNAIEQGLIEALKLIK